MLSLLLAWVTATGDGVAPRPAPGEPDSVSRVALEAALQAFDVAFLRADAEVLDTLLVTEYLHTNGGGGSVLDKAQWLDYVRRRRADLESGRLRVTRYESSNVTVRWHPGTAVVSSRVLAEGVQDGVPFASRLQVTQVWIRVGERWRRAAFHDSPLPR
jgi:hypothetical protein